MQILKYEAIGIRHKMYRACPLLNKDIREYTKILFYELKYAVCSFYTMVLSFKLMNMCVCVIQVSITVILFIYYYTKIMKNSESDRIDFLNATKNV